ncbi:tetratricopeptide repeat protein [Thiocapsa roseopersicina]|uniref:Sel1 repeat-containing protein n=1 Tax=Thiocapsa roseopersicina TaxID=1058 RepID=A0A1H2Y8R4_THIRO|nr:tetratricopeptide repeat protein [Thiocapsa roseopersicina]SDX01613.1 Sel1 repeat-containing protein [Thiocapsa roseopersicina]
MLNTVQTRCPVCGIRQSALPKGAPPPACAQCGWDFPIFLGTDVVVRAGAQQRLDAAQAAWRAQRYVPDLLPKLTRDSFETADEFAARLAARPWCVGEAELQKTDFDVESGRFPVTFRNVHEWARYRLAAVIEPHLNLPGEQARMLFQQAAVWPVYTTLSSTDDRIELRALMLVAGDAELPVRADEPWSPPYPPIHRRARAGDRDARNILGWMYATGTEIARDPVEAVRWFRLAAEQGSAAAQCNLGLCHYHGEGVEYNAAEAANWFRRSAAQHWGKAEFMLGECYRRGCGVGSNVAEAANWYRRAADQGYADAQEALTRL